MNDPDCGSFSGVPAWLAGMPARNGRAADQVAVAEGVSGREPRSANLGALPV